MLGQTGSPPHLKEGSGLVKLTGEVGQKQIGCFSNFCIGLNFKQRSCMCLLTLASTSHNGLSLFLTRDHYCKSLDIYLFLFFTYLLIFSATVSTYFKFGYLLPVQLLQLYLFPFYLSPFQPPQGSIYKPTSQRY